MNFYSKGEFAFVRLRPRACIGLTIILQALEWQPANRLVVCSIFGEKQYGSVPPKEWLLLAMIMLQYLDAVNVTFNSF